MKWKKNWTQISTLLSLTQLRLTSLYPGNSYHQYISAQYMFPNECYLLAEYSDWVLTGIVLTKKLDVCTHYQVCNPSGTNYLDKHPGNVLFIIWQFDRMFLIFSILLSIHRSLCYDAHSPLIRYFPLNVEYYRSTLLVFKHHSSQPVMGPV